MLATVSLVVAGLSTGNKIGLAAVGGAFILFALVSSFILPARSANFPGRYVGWFSALGVLFLVAMLSAVLIFGKEKKEATPRNEPAQTATTTAAAPATTAMTTGAAPAAGGGDPVAGKKVFASAGCSACHVLKASGATGTVGPNLDQLKPDAARVERQVIKGGGPMPAFKGTLTDAQIKDVAAYVATSTHS